MVDPFNLAHINVARPLWREIRTKNGSDDPGEREAVRALYTRLVPLLLRIPPIYRLAAGGTVTVCRPGRHRIPGLYLRERIDVAIHRTLWRSSTGGGAKEL